MATQNRTESKSPLQLFEDARIGKKNFKGELTDFGEDKGRTFRIYFTEDPDRAHELAALGYNIKGGDPIPETNEFYPTYLEVGVQWGKYPPEVWIVNGTADNEPRSINEQMLGSLDSLRFSRADVIVRPYEWKVGPKTGTKAYLKKIYVTIDKEAAGLDPLTARYGF